MQRYTTLLLVMMIGVSTSCQIPKKSNPLCGTNGVSYVNVKALQCYNQENPQRTVRLAYMGRCIRPDIPECNYAARSRPVCGNDGLTYLNAAMVACKNKLQPKKQTKIIAKGPCNKSRKPS